MHNFTRRCPDCTQELTYSSKGNFEWAETRASLCHPCAQKHAPRWNVGKDKTNDPKVAQLSSTISKAMNDPELRARLDSKKKLPKERLIQIIDEASSTWELVDDLSSYKKLTEKNIQFRCMVCSQEQTMSISDVHARVRCKKCNPIKGKGSSNPAYVSINSFLSKIIDKFGLERFQFDPNSYVGMRSKMSWKCTDCSFEFEKAPGILVGEKIGCPQCAERSRRVSQSRTELEFRALVEKIYHGKFTYFPAHDQKWKDMALISLKCNDCGTEKQQTIGSHYVGGCGVCSQKIKHTTGSFIAKSKSIHGAGAFDYSLVEYVGNKEHVELTCKKKNKKGECCNHNFKVTPANHWSRGCPQCAARKFVSIGETQWLNSLGISESCRNRFIKANDELFNCDGVVGKTIYEYYGDYWHGNPKRFAPESMNHLSGVSMAERYQDTLDREQLLRDAGYEIVTMWESEWNDILRAKKSS